jgi:hypothetical protein
MEPDMKNQLPRPASPRKRGLSLLIQLVAGCAILVLLIIKGAYAQDRIELYADINRTQCTLSEAVSPPIVYVYVFLTGPVPARGARFTVPKPACWQGATWVGDTLNPLHEALLDSQRDWNLAFFPGVSLDCTALNKPPIYIGRVNFFVTGQSLPCCQVTPMPGLTYEFLDCNFGEYPLASGGSVVTVNANASCPCQSPLATESSSWGRVKALYR